MKILIIITIYCIIHTNQKKGGDYMVCNSTKEILAEIKKYMDLHGIQMKNLAVSMHKSQQSVSQIFQNGNPTCNTLLEICDALNINFDINLYNKSDTK